MPDRVAAPGPIPAVEGPAPGDSVSAAVLVGGISSEVMLMLLADARLPTGAHTQSAGLEPALRGGMLPAQVPQYMQARLRTVTSVEAGAAVLARAAVISHAEHGVAPPDTAPARPDQARIDADPSHARADPTPAPLAPSRANPTNPCADQRAASVTTATRVNDFGRADEDDPRELGSPVAAPGDVAAQRSA